MNVLVQFSDTISPVFHWVLETSLQASVVVVLILLTQWLLRHRLPVRWYYGLWLALVIRLILPVAPESPLSIFNLIDQGWEASSTYFVTGEVAQEAITTPDTLLATPATYTPTESLIVTTQSAPSTQAAVTATSKVPTSSDNTTTLSPDQATTLSMHWQGVLSLVWFVGVCLLVTYVLLINLWYTLRLRYAAPVEDTTLLAVFEDSATRMKTSGVRLFESHLLKSPAIFGFYRPKLLLPPQAVQELTPQELRYVFLHELAHVRRKDIVMNWFCTLLLALHWFNPVLWFAFRRIRHDRELACDDFALRHTESGEAQAYGMTMLSLLRKHQKAAPFPGMAGLAGVVEAHSATGNRIRRIAAFRYDGRTWSMLAIAVSLIFGTVTLTNAQNPSDAGLVSQPSSQEEHDILLVAALNRADCANHLREWGLIFKMYASDNRGLFPLFSKDAGYLMPEPTLVYPDYVKDMRILICPARSPVPDIPVNPLSDASLRTHFQSSDYYYLGYALRDDTDVEAFAAAYQVSVETGEVLPDILQATSEDGEKRHILRLNEGVERFFITDINSPATSTRAQSAIPVMMDKLGNHPDGGNVLYMDGHIEFVQYGVWPMTERTHNALASLAALHGKTMVTTTTERPVASGMSRGMGMGGVQEGLYGARRAQQPEPEKNKEEIIKSLVEQLRVHLSAETAQELFRLGWWPEDDTLLLVRYLVSLQRIYGLEKYGDLTVETFSEYNKQTMPEEEILKHLVDTLRKIDTPAASVLLREIYQKRLGRLNDLLITGGKDARKSSVVELGSRGYPEALPPLRMALHDVEEEVRNAAIVAIGRLNTDEASATLGALLVAVPRTNVRGWPNPYISLSTQALLEMDTELGLPILYRKVIEQDLDENWCKNTAWEIIQRLGENPRDSRFDIFGPNEKSGWQERFEAWAMSHSSVFGLPEHNSSAMPIREFTEDELSRDFRFAVGQPGNPVESGILKLYCIGWGFVHEYDLGLVENGMLNFTFTPEMLVGRLSDRQTNDLSYENLIDFLTMGRRTFVVALSLPDNHWYRAPDQVLTEEFKIYREQNIPLDELITLYWKEVLHMVYTGISGMAAEVASTQSGISTMILPELEERVILILDENGTPMTNKEVRLAVYMTTENHCGGHHGLALGTFSTDTNGEIHVIAPALPLYLEEALYYDPDGIYAGIPVYLGREGLMIGPNPLEVVQKAWPENFEPRDLHLTVLDSNGTPMPDVTVHVRLRLQVCGAISRQHGRSGEDGIVHLHLLEHQVPPIARLVELWRYQDNDEGVFIDQDINRPLLEEELADLFANGHTTIVWDYEESLAQNNSV